MSGHVFLVGLSHKSAPIEVRERVALSGDALKTALRYVGWTLVFMALLSGLVLFVGGWGVLGWLLLGVAVVRGIARYRHSQRQALWASLALAAVST